MTNKCEKCPKLISEKEKQYFDDSGATFLFYDKYLCENHWCECMPKSTPWKWLNSCDICSRTICKTCKFETDNNLICQSCADCLSESIDE